MNGAQELLHSGHCCTRALQAGRAPAYWQRELQQQTTRIKALPQYCHWMASVAKVQMKLQDQPLLGSCLPALTGRTERPSTHPPTQPRSLPAPQQILQSHAAKPDEICPSPQRFARQHSTLDQSSLPQPEPSERLALKEPDTGTNHCSAREPLRLPSRASANLLQCLVEKPISAKSLQESVAESKSQDVSPEILIRKRFTPISPPPPRTPKTPRDACLNATDQKRWRQQLTHRTDDCLRSESTRLNSSGLPISKQADFQPFMESSNRSENKLSNNPWLYSLGTTAPLDLLTDLATPPIGSDRHAESDHLTRSLSTSEPRPSDHGSDQVPTQPRPAIVPWQNFQSQSPLERLSQLSDRIAKEPMSDRIAKKPKAAELERIDPPAVASTLPPLVASQTGEASPSVTTPLIQQRAMQEAIPEADLDSLASQIKRILDEEARRYGINI